MCPASQTSALRSTPAEKLVWIRQASLNFIEVSSVTEPTNECCESVLCIAVLRSVWINFAAVAGKWQCTAGQPKDKRRSRGKLLMLNSLGLGGFYWKHAFFQDYPDHADTSNLT